MAAITDRAGTVATATPDETKSKCSNCDGVGWNFMAPRGVNPFMVRIENLARRLERRTCWRCHGAGTL